MRSITGTARTRKLATARLEFSRDRRMVTLLQGIASLALLVLVIAAGSRLYADSRAPTSLAGLQRQNASLQANLARVQTELELERSTRAALARQVAQLSEESNDLQARLDFFNAQNSRAARTP